MFCIEVLLKISTIILIKPEPANQGVQDFFINNKQVCWSRVGMKSAEVCRVGMKSCYVTLRPGILTSSARSAR